MRVADRARGESGGLASRGSVVDARQPADDGHPVPLASGRGTSLAAAQAQSPRSRVTGRRPPEAAYRRAGRAVGPEPKAPAKVKSRKLREAEAKHRAAHKRRLVDRRGQHPDVLVPEGELDELTGQPVVLAPRAGPELPEPGEPRRPDSPAPPVHDDGGTPYHRIPYTAGRSPGRARPSVGRAWGQRPRCIARPDLACAPCGRWGWGEFAGPIPACGQGRCARRRGGHCQSEDKRGRRPHLAFGRRNQWVSAADVARMDAGELGKLLVRLAYVRDRAGHVCPRCDAKRAPDDARGSLALAVRGTEPVWRCTGRRSCQAFVRFAEAEPELWADGVSVRVQALLLWHFAMAASSASPCAAGRAGRVVLRSKFHRGLLRAHARLGGKRPVARQSSP